MLITDLKKIDRSVITRLILIHILIISLSNYLVQFGGEFLGIKFTWGMFVFPLIIVLTDLTIRLFNQNLARIVVILAFIPAFFISSLLADFLIGLASATAYLVGQIIDIFFFQRIRNKTDLWWVAPSLSTLVANSVDTYLFFWIAFSKSSDTFMSSNWLMLAHTDLVFKITISILIFLPVYGLLLNFLQDKFRGLN